MTNHLQPVSSWQLDWLSLGIGLGVGVLLTLLLVWLWPRLKQGGDQARNRWRRLFTRLRSSDEVKYLADTAVYLEQHHLGRPWANLSQVFTPPRLYPLQYPIHEEEDALDDAGRFHQLWPELAAGVAAPPLPAMNVRQLLQNGRRVVLTGDAGSGKTTLLAYAAYRCAADAEAETDPFLLPLLPVFLHLAELDPARLETADPLDPLVALLQQRHAGLSRGGLQKLLAQKGKSGDLWLFLDGGDVAPVMGETAVYQWLHRLLETYPAARVLVAAGLTGYGDLLERSFTLATILPWRPQQVETFADRWATALGIKTPPLNRYWRPGQSAHEIALRFWLVAHGVRVEAADAPARMADLMGVCLTQFFTPAASEDTASIRAFWQRLAFTLLNDQKAGLSAAAVEAAAAETASEPEPLPASLDSPLFVRGGSGEIRFRNRAWRDYLAGLYMAEADLEETAVAHLIDPAWRGAIRFYVGEVGATDLGMKFLTTSDSTPTRELLFQLAGWMAVVPDEGEWQRQVLILLGQIIRQRTFAQALRQRAAAALTQSEEEGVFRFLTQLLERSDPVLRRTGTALLPYLGWRRPDEVIPLLVKMTTDGDGTVRQTAVAGLAWLHHPQAEKPLLRALLEGDEAMKRVAAEGLALNGRLGVEILREALEDDAPAVRRAAAAAAAWLDEAWVTPQLRQLERQDADATVRAAAGEALAWRQAQQKPEPWRPLPAKAYPWLVTYAQQKGRVTPEGAAVLPFLVQILAESSRPMVRAAAAKTLAYMPTRDAMPALETAVRDTEEEVREAAFATLCQLRRAYGER